MAKTPALKIDLDFNPALEAICDRLDIQNALWDIETEIGRARFKHGKQNDLPFGTGPEESIFGEVGNHTWADLHDLSNRDLETLAKKLCNGTGVAWSHILFEEVAEALAANDPDELEAELIQVAAMATSFLIAVRHQRYEAAKTSES